MPRPLEKLAEKAEDVDTFLRTALPSSCFFAIRLLSARNLEACFFHISLMHDKIFEKLRRKAEDVKPVSLKSLCSKLVASKSETFEAKRCLNMLVTLGGGLAPMQLFNRFCNSLPASTTLKV